MQHVIVTLTTLRRFSCNLLLFFPGCTESLLDAPIRPNLCPVSTVPGHPTPEAMLDPESTIHPLLTNLPLTPTLPMSGSTIGMGTRFLPTRRAHHGHPTMAHPDSVDVVDTPGSTAAGKLSFIVHLDRSHCSYTLKEWSHPV